MWINAAVQRRARRYLGLAEFSRDRILWRSQAPENQRQGVGIRTQLTFGCAKKVQGYGLK
jgi:hypothetical protein